MEAEFEARLERLLRGEGLSVSESDLSARAEPVVLKKSVCYVVSAVIFNSKDEVLMVQEAKRECYGRWYLPAGRVEEGESLVQALRREVREEAGPECQPLTLLLVQEQRSQWLRLVFLAEVTGGALKTTAQADGESLQADWWDRESPLPLRGRDILSLIEAGLKYRRLPWFPASLPVALPCPVVCQRLVLVFVSGVADGPRLWLLLGGAGASALPVGVSVNASLARAGQGVVERCMASASVSAHTRGVLAVQHAPAATPGQTDGVCFNTLVLLRSAREEAELSGPPPLECDDYRWCEVTNHSLRAELLRRVTEGSVLPVCSLGS